MTTLEFLEAAMHHTEITHLYVSHPAVYYNQKVEEIESKTSKICYKIPKIL